MNGENLQANKTNQAEKARLGAIGENQVVSMLMQNGWDAFNANCTIKNLKLLLSGKTQKSIKILPEAP